MTHMQSASKPADRSSKRKAFAWVKKLGLLKSSHNSSHSKKSKDGSTATASEAHKRPTNISNTNGVENASGQHVCPDVQAPAVDGRTGDSVLPGASHNSLTNIDGRNPHMAESNKSVTPTIETNNGTVHSDGGQSKAPTSGTINTAGALSSASVGGGGNSIFSSSNPSARSLTTTLTTIQSNVPAGQQGQSPSGAGPNHQHHTSQSSTYFSHQYPTTPASAVPPHLIPHATNVPMTYRSATANNLLTDNASVITLASSSQAPHRRNSLDTNASVRAIPPSSVWGGSRESLPLSVLSREAGPMETQKEATQPQTPSQQLPGGIYSAQQRPSIGGLASTERASVYSSSGATQQPAGVSSSRNSVHAGRSIAADGSSVRSGLTGHGRQDSVGGSISGLTSPKENTSTLVPNGYEGQMAD